MQCVGLKVKKVSNLYFLCKSCNDFVNYSNAPIDDKLTRLEEQLSMLSTTLNHKIVKLEERITAEVNDLNKKITCLGQKNEETEKQVLSFHSNLESLEQSFKKQIQQLENKFSSFENIAHKNSSHNKPPDNNKNEINTKLRYQLRFSGIKEAPENTKYIERQQYDFEQIDKIIKHIGKNNVKVTDSFRLGKFKKENKRPRSILVTFSSVWDRNIVLQSAFTLSSYDVEVYISPALTVTEMEIEKKLLKKRRELIDSGIERKTIKIRKMQLYVGDKAVETD